MARALAVIPARGGSKGIPRKNVVDLNGRPLIAWTITQAKEAGVFDYIHVSTDDEGIAETAQRFGAGCAFLRPPEFAGDSVGTGGAIFHTIEKLETLGHTFDIVAELQPTYCFRGSELTRECLQKLRKDDDADAVATCTSIESTAHPDFAVRVDSAGYAQFGRNKPDSFARQNLDPYLAVCGIVLAAYTEVYKLRRTFYVEKCRLVAVTDPVRAHDINDAFDLEVARCVASRHPGYLR